MNSPARQQVATDLNNVEDFVRTCRDLLSVRGKLVSDHIGGGLMFTDGGLHLHEKRDGSLTVTYYYGDANGRPTTNNPVIMTDERGKMFRCHGEWRKGIDRVQQYLVSNFAMKEGGLIPCPYHYDAK